MYTGAEKAWHEVHQGEATARSRRKEANLAILRASSVPMLFRNNNESILIRDPAYPAADFFPSGNKWRFAGRHILGDANVFLEWLERKRKA